VLRSHTIKAELSQDELDALDAILAGLDFAGWAALAGDIQPLLDEIVSDGSYAAFGQVGVDVTTDPEALAMVNSQALDYARERSAEMVGKRRNLAGDLVDNPDAEWRIDDSTREFLRADVGQALADGWSNDKLASTIADSYAFSDDRAMTIARTETQMAANTGAVNGYKASGVVDGKQWLTAEDDLVSEDCVENGAAGDNGDGVIGLDEDFPSGDDAPPAHPNCRCSIAPYIDFSSADADQGA
jgi:SPP1 gp7 family putative phage head morphogenesis protein